MNFGTNTRFSLNPTPSAAPNTSSEIIQNQLLNNGANTINHTLGEVAKVVNAYDSNGQPLAITWGNLSATQISINNAMPAFANCTIEITI